MNEYPTRRPFIDWEPPLCITGEAWKKKSKDWTWTMSYDPEQQEMPYYLFNSDVCIGAMATSEEEALDKFFQILRERFEGMKKLLEAYDNNK
jgi:hypothetical protein